MGQLSIADKAKLLEQYLVKKDKIQCAFIAQGRLNAYTVEEVLRGARRYNDLNPWKVAFLVYDKQSQTISDTRIITMFDLIGYLKTLRLRVKELEYGEDERLAISTIERALGNLHYIELAGRKFVVVTKAVYVVGDDSSTDIVILPKADFETSYVAKADITREAVTITKLKENHLILEQDKMMCCNISGLSRFKNNKVGNIPNVVSYLYSGGLKHSW